MNILEILNSLGTQNIEGLINLLSTLFGNSNNKPQVTLPPNKIESPPETNFDANSSYWSLPTYQFDTSQTPNSAQNGTKSQSTMQHNVTQSKFTNTNTQTIYNNQQPAYIDNTMQQNSMHNTMHSTTNSNKNNNFFEIIKVLLPLLSKSSPNNTYVANTEQPKFEQKESVILSLKKTSEK